MVSERTSLTLENKKNNKNNCCFSLCKYIPQRWIHGFHILLGMTLFGLILRIVSVTSIPMTDSEYVAPSGQNSTVYHSNSKTNGFIFGIEFIGLAISAIISSFFVNKYSNWTKWIFSLSILFPGILTILYPVFASLDIHILIAVRFIQGLFVGNIFGFYIQLIIDWAPRTELTTFSILHVTGTQLGNLLVMISGGFMVDYINWQAAFYIIGSTVVFFAIYLLIFMKNHPRECSLITKEELLYLNENTVSCERVPLSKVPWRQMLLSAPLWVTLVCGICDQWVRYGFYYDIPTYLNDVLDCNMHEVGLINMIILVTNIIVGQSVCLISDKIIERNENRRLNVRKIVILIGGIGQCICYIAITFSTSKINLLFLGINFGIFHAFYGVVYNVNIIELAPHYANNLNGIAFFARSFFPAFSPIVTGLIVTNKNHFQWNIVFYIYTAIMLIPTVCFCIFGKSEVQEWSKPDHIELNDTINEYDTCTNAELD